MDGGRSRGNGDGDGEMGEVGVERWVAAMPGQSFALGTALSPM